MKRKSFWTGLLSSLGMLILILDGKTAMDGVKNGISLCLMTVIPSLFPFFLFSNLLTAAYVGHTLPFLSPFVKLCGIPKGTESIPLIGFIGGYPVGAQMIGDAYRGGQLRQSQAERMLAFCNNAGPAFIFGIAASLFPSKWMGLALWGIHILSAVMTACVLPGQERVSATLPIGKPITLTEAMNKSIRVMASVCGWIVFFRMLIAFFSRWFLWLFPSAVQIGIIGILELSNGCLALKEISNVSLRFLMCSGMLALGGLCVTMQTASTAKGLSLKYYFIGKLLQTEFSLLFSWSIIMGTWPVVFILLPPGILFWRKAQKRGSIQALAGV